MIEFVEYLPQARGRSAVIRRAGRVADRGSSVVCALAIALLVVLLAGTVAGYRPLIDHSDSMRPAVRAGDLILTHAEDATSVRAGDIVTFVDPALGSKLVTHRVVAFHASGTRINFVTRGDANSASETWSVNRRALGRQAGLPRPRRRPEHGLDGLAVATLNPAGPGRAGAQHRTAATYLEGMMRRHAAPVALALLALAATWSLILGGTLSAYTATTATPSGPFVAAPDWVAPTASAAVVGRSTAYDTGSIAQGTTYYLYANASDTGNPASGISGVPANLSSITAGKTFVALTAGTYSAGGVSYGFRSPS